MTAKANDVLELGRARALLGCSSSMSLLDGVRAVKSELTDALAEVERLRAEVEQLRGRSDEERGEP
jgi:hypothetical protein